MFDEVYFTFPCFYCGEEIRFYDQVKGYCDSLEKFGIGDVLYENGTGMSEYIHSKNECKSCGKEEEYSVVFLNDVIKTALPSSLYDEVNSFFKEKEIIRIIISKKDLERPELLIEKIKKMESPKNEYGVVDISFEKKDFDNFISKLKTP